MNKKNIYFVVIFLMVASFVAYGRILGNEFINFDDTHYITQNSHIQSGFNLESIKWALSSSVQFYYWHPLTWFSHMLDWTLFKDKPGGHHLVNLLLHLGSVIFLFLFLNRTTKNIWPSAFAAALFALHPLRVESVAWAAERKDVLSMFIGMTCLYAYARYVEDYKISRYIVCLMLFALSLTAKPTMVTLPFVFLLLDYWPLGRWQQVLAPAGTPAVAAETESRGENKNRQAKSIEKQKIPALLTSRAWAIRYLLWEKAPFLLLTIASSILTYWGQEKSELVASLEAIPLAARFQNTIISYGSYLRKTVWPSDLAIWYPYKFTVPFGEFLFFLILLIGITVAVIYTVKKFPFLFVGWFWYLGTLIPMIGLVQLSWIAMADRFSYLPSIGIAMMLAWGIPRFFPRTEIRKNILYPAAIAVLSILTALTWHQCGYWKNSFELYSHCLRVTKDNADAYLHFGMALAEKGKFKEAIVQYDKGFSIMPDFRILFAKGNAHSALGQYSSAIEDFNEVIRLSPDFADVYLSRGNDYSALGQYQIAISDFNEAIRLKPEAVMAYLSRGNAYSAINQYQTAIGDYNEAIRLKPDFVIVYLKRGNVYSEINQYQPAIEDFSEVIRLRPDFAEAFFNRANIYVRGPGQYELAIKDYNEVIRLKPDFVEAYFNKGGLLINHGNKKMGCLDLKKACELGKCKVLQAAKNQGYCP
jgi:protein O-mannosyl-transferase